MRRRLQCLACAKPRGEPWRAMASVLRTSLGRVCRFCTHVRNAWRTALACGTKSRGDSSHGKLRAGWHQHVQGDHNARFRRALHKCVPSPRDPESGLRAQRFQGAGETRETCVITHARLSHYAVQMQQIRHAHRRHTAKHPTSHPNHSPEKRAKCRAPGLALQRANPG